MNPQKAPLPQLFACGKPPDEINRRLKIWGWEFDPFSKNRKFRVYRHKKLAARPGDEFEKEAKAENGPELRRCNGRSVFWSRIHALDAHLQSAGDVGMQAQFHIMVPGVADRLGEIHLFLI